MSLFETGRDNLENQFKEYLAKHSQPLSGNILVDAVNSDEGGKDKLVLSLSNLTAMNHFFCRGDHCKLLCTRC